MRSLLVVLLCSLGVYANALTLPEHFKAEFTQKITNAKKKVITYKGKVYFSNKSHSKWDYHVPTKKQVCINGRELTVVDHELEQVSQYAIDKGFNFSKILENAKPHKKNIYVAKYENISYTIQVDVHKRLHSIAYFNEDENKVQIIFKKVKYGKGSLNKKLLGCKIPKDYDIIRG
jgi:outer membrane lipoprotein carrier protein